MSRSLFIVSVLLAILIVPGLNLFAIDHLGRDRLAGLPKARVAVEFDFDSQSETSFLRSKTQIRDRIVRILRDNGRDVSTETNVPTINCYIRLRLLTLTLANQQVLVFGYRVETAVVEEVSLTRTPPKSLRVPIWQKADFGIVLPDKLNEFVEAQLDKQIETLADDWETS